MKAWYLRLSTGAKLALIVSLLTTISAAAAFLLSWQHTIQIQALGEPAGYWINATWDCSMTGRGSIDNVTAGDSPTIALSGVDDEGTLQCSNVWHNAEATASEEFIAWTVNGPILEAAFTGNGTPIVPGEDRAIQLDYTWPTLAPGGAIAATIDLTLGFAP